MCFAVSPIHRYRRVNRLCISIVFVLNQIKSLLLSHHHSTSALVSEILTSVLQTVQKNNRQFTYGQTVQKKQQQQFTYGQTVQKNNSNLHMDRQCKKQQFTYGQYIFTDCTEDNVQNTHTYTQYTQCTIKTISYRYTLYTVCTRLHYLHIYA